MKTILIACLHLLLIQPVWAQELHIVRQSGSAFPKLNARETFYFLEETIDTVALPFVACIKVTTKENPSVEALYDKIKGKARELGANAFYLLEHDDASLLVNLYRANKEALSKNNELKPKNTFYIFAGEKSENKEYYGFELNGASKTIKNGTYFHYTLKEGERVKLKKGTVTGTTMWINWKPDQLPNYYSIHGFHKEPVVKRTTVSTSERPSKFVPIEDGLGALLTRVLTPQTE